MPDINGLPEFEAASPFDSTYWGPKGSYNEGLGMLNVLTPEVRLAAKEAIVDGESHGLNWNLRHIVSDVPFGRVHPEDGRRNALTLAVLNFTTASSASEISMRTTMYSTIEVSEFAYDLTCSQPLRSASR